MARILEWAVILFSRGSAWPVIKPISPALQADFLPSKVQGKPKFKGYIYLTPYRKNWYIVSAKYIVPHVQGKRNPSKTVGVARGHQRADTLKPYSQKTCQSNHTRTTALSNSMKLSHALWGHPRHAGHGGEVWQNVVHWRREWQTTLVFLPWEPHEQYEKAKW